MSRMDEPEILPPDQHIALIELPAGVLPPAPSGWERAHLPKRIRLEPPLPRLDPTS